MKKANMDPKVKKTLVRNCERKVTTVSGQKVVRNVESLPDMNSSTTKNNPLSEPTLCSSAVLANYLTEVKNSEVPPLSAEDINVDRGQLCAKMTKKLNFHFNDRIYRNLVELNASIQELKSNKKEKKSTSSINTLNKDAEPDIEDFCDDEKDSDIPPKVLSVKPKFKPIKIVENGHLHRLISSFDIL